VLTWSFLLYYQTIQCPMFRWGSPQTVDVLKLLYGWMDCAHADSSYKHIKSFMHLMQDLFPRGLLLQPSLSMETWRNHYEVISFASKHKYQYIVSVDESLQCLFSSMEATLPSTALYQRCTTCGRAPVDNEMCGRPRVISNKIWRPCWRLLKQNKRKARNF